MKTINTSKPQNDSDSSQVMSLDKSGTAESPFILKFTRKQRLIIKYVYLFTLFSICARGQQQKTSLFELFFSNFCSFSYFFSNSVCY